jgi:thiol-disulfide isomerase/thioredoxin
MFLSKLRILPLVGAVSMLLCFAIAPARAESASPRRWVDVDGQPLALFGEDAKPSVVVFLGTECPISNQYVPVLNELAAKHHDGGVRFFGIVSDSSLSRRAVAAYRDEAKLTFPVIFDASGALAESLKPKRTPEAFRARPRR